MAYTPATLSALLRDLSVSSDVPKHTEILKHANNVLKTNKSHSEALHTKVVALLHLDRFDDVVKTLTQTPLEQAKFELAYALYKSGKWEAAEEVAREAQKVREVREKVRRGLAHVEAQAAHRSEKFAHAADIYRDLIADGQVVVANEDYDLKVNRNATEAQLVWSGAQVGKRSISGEELGQFETTFNAACIHVARNEFPQGLMLLKKARGLCEEMDLMEEERKDELAPVFVQQIYTLLKLGKFDEAATLEQQLDTQKLSEKYLASNNSICLKSHRIPNPHLALRYFEATVTDILHKTPIKPYSFQSRILFRNKLGLDLQVGKYDAVAYAACKSKDPARQAFTVAANSGGKTPQEILKDVTKVLAAEGDKTNIAVSLYATQVYMSLGNTTGAIETIECLLNELDKKESEERQGNYPPALVGLLVALHQQQGRKKAPNQLYKAASYWSSQPNPNSSLLLSAAFQLLTSSQSPTAPSLPAAGALLSSIPPLSTQISPAILSAGLVAAYATASPELAKPHLASLPALDTLLNGIDVNALEAAGIYTESKKRSSIAVEADSGGIAKKVKAQHQQAKKKRERKNRLPKNYVEGKEIDKERWLPLRERSYYKPDKKKKGSKRNIAQGSGGGTGATQGGRVENENSAVDSAQTKVVATPAGGGGSGSGGQSKKKKKKGTKW